MSEPQVETLLSGAIDHSPTGRNDAGLWLACQLRDNGYTESQAKAAMRGYAAAVGSNGDHPYTEQEALATLRSAYSRSAREPWNTTIAVNSKPATAPPKFTLISSADFAAARYQLDWYAKPVLTKQQPAILGGPMKVLKTSIAVDLAVSLSTGTPFLGKFQTSESCRVALLSGESGEAVLQETAKRVCIRRMRTLSECRIWWGFRLPQLARPGDLSALGDALQEHKIAVLILDPLYLSLLAGDVAGRSASNLFDMGPILLAVAEMANECGCTPILLHHFKKTLADPYAPAELPDLAYSGVAEFARQWLLLSRRQEYEPGSGQHALWLSVGGSAGHGGLYAVDVNEGTLGEDFSGRTWQVDVRPATQARQDAKQHKEAEQRQAKVERVLTALAKYPKGETLRFLTDVAGMRYNPFVDVINDLERQGMVEQCEIEKRCGKGTRQLPAVKLKEPHR